MAKRWIIISGFLFAVTFQKYATRDPLGQSAGLQAVLEIGLTLLPCVVILLLSRGMEMRVGIHRSLWFFAIYGIFAMASSVHSFNPSLSLVKSFLYFAVLMLAYLLAEQQLGIVFLEGVYYGYIATVVGGLILAVTSPGKYPLFIIDDWNGRTRLGLWTTHPNSTGEVSGLFFLLALILPMRTRWYLQVFLLGINIAAGEKTATAALFLSMLLIFLFGKRDAANRWKALVAVGALAAAGVACISAGVIQVSPGKFAGNAAQAIYGKEVSNEVTSLDGRADVWSKGGDMAKDCVVLGFGFEGAREYLMSMVSWAGHAHNGILQALLSAGMVGTLALLIGWGCSIRDSLNGDRGWKMKVIALHLYLFALVMVGPAFDSPSYLTMLLFVVVLYSVLEREKSWTLEMQTSTGLLQLVD
jgi:O-antigen ligase